MDQTHILIVEDNKEYQLFLKALVQLEGHVRLANNIAEARRSMQEQIPQLVLLDIGMGDENGFEFCSEIKKSESWKDVPVIFLTAKEDTPDKVTGFSIGADDYIVKTSDPLEIQVRVRSVLRRYKKKSAMDGLNLGGVKVDFSIQRASLTSSARAVNEYLDLTPTEFKILAFLMRNEGKTFSRQRLLEEIWGENLQVAGRTIDTHVHALRKKLKEYSPRIESIFGTGYRFSSSAEIDNSPNA